METMTTTTTTVGVEGAPHPPPRVDAYRTPTGVWARTWVSHPLYGVVSLRPTDGVAVMRIPAGARIHHVSYTGMDRDRVDWSDVVTTTDPVWVRSDRSASVPVVVHVSAPVAVDDTGVSVCPAPAPCGGALVRVMDVMSVAVDAPMSWVTVPACAHACSWCGGDARRGDGMGGDMCATCGYPAVPRPASTRDDGAGGVLCATCDDLRCEVPRHGACPCGDEAVVRDGRCGPCAVERHEVAR